jgi:hypothetical protein
MKLALCLITALFFFPVLSHADDFDAEEVGKVGIILSAEAVIPMDGYLGEVTGCSLTSATGTVAVPAYKVWQRKYDEKKTVANFQNVPYTSSAQFYKLVLEKGCETQVEIRIHGGYLWVHPSEVWASIQTKEGAIRRVKVGCL